MLRCDKPPRGTQHQVAVQSVLSRTCQQHECGTDYWVLMLWLVLVAEPRRDEGTIFALLQLKVFPTTGDGHVQIHRETIWRWRGTSWCGRMPLRLPGGKGPQYLSGYIRAAFTRRQRI